MKFATALAAAAVVGCSAAFLLGAGAEAHEGLNSARAFECGDARARVAAGRGRPRRRLTR